MRQYSAIRHLWVRLTLVLCVLGLSPLPLSAQSDEPERSEARVAPDLERIYRKTSTARTIDDFSSILDFCRKAQEDPSRPAEERAYLRTLASWGANRRGELHSDQAAQYAAQQKIEEAKRLDEQAMADFDLAIRNDPKRWRAHHNRAIILALQGDGARAIEAFDRVIELNASYPNAYFNRGEIHFQNKRFDAAIADYSQAIALDSKDPSLACARGHAKFAKGLIAEALADYATATELAPESSLYATEFADANQSIGLWKPAAESYQRAMQLDPSNTRALQNAAWMMATCPDEFFRNGPAAVQTANKAVDATLDSGPSVHLLDVLAAAHAANGDFAPAQEAIQKALKLTTDPSQRQELLARGNLYQRKVAYVQPSTNVAEKRAPAPVRRASNPTRRRS